MRMIKVHIETQGRHHWPQGGKPEYPELATPHSHNFHINIYMPIEDDNNRSIEFIHFAHVLELFLRDRFRSPKANQVYIDFQDRSCGNIADEVYQIIFSKDMKIIFPALENVGENMSAPVSIEVLEDGGHGEMKVY
jgi:hypothetical protein